ncbi:glycogen/starch synthase, partial [Photobacterium damselae]|uniref:glycogen/starch synthase n=1 Tax=Photobacterium damselae TaxID=38293 RepID=UPI004067E801
MRALLCFQQEQKLVSKLKPAGKALKILFVASEVHGLVKTGGLADVDKSLPATLKSLGHDVRIVLHFYQT